MKKQIIENELELEICGERLQFHSNRVMYWPAQKTLFLSDPHFGKVSHFRKRGIAVPNQMLEKDYIKLEESILHFNPDTVIILGDLFHSVQNLEWDLLKDFIESFQDIHFQLVIGNHDILSNNTWHDSEFEVFHDHLVNPPFILTHYPMEVAHKEYYNLAGHVHPGVRLRGGPGTSVRLPCFFFNHHQGILPAFGDFTGNFKMKPKKGDRIIAIADQQLIFFE